MAATLNARLRDVRGKNAARKLRGAGEVPAVVYGHGDSTRALAVSAHELERLLAHISAENTIIDLQVDGGATVPALIREVQHHSTRPVILHVDFYQVHAGETLHVDVPVHYVGSPIGVRDSGGVLQEILRELAIECLPKDIPEGIEVDVSELDIGGNVHVRDLNVPNVKILNDVDLVLCTVSGPTLRDLGETPESEDGVGGEGEPELIRDREADAAE